jgi:signal transduction histidine kinase
MFLDPTLFSLDQLINMTMVVVEGQAIIYTFDPERHPGRVFAGMLLRGREGEWLGAGGWWLDSRRFLTGRLRQVVDLRLADNPRIYGGVQDVRSLSVTLLDRAGRLINRVRDPAHPKTAYTHWLPGPFDGYGLRVSAASGATVSWIGRFVGFELAFIAVMVLVLASAVVYAMSYTAKQLQLAQHKASFVSNVTHELKTPLALIQLAVETLEMRRLSSLQDQEKFLRTIGRETHRLTRLVDNILDFSRLEAGRREFHLTPTDLAAVTQEVFDSFRPRLEEQGFRTELHLPAGLPPVMGEAQALQQCVANLIDNAVKYSRERKEIRIAAEARDGLVALSVSDRGIGIAPGDQPRIFEEFVRLGEGLVHEVKGTGLGLALVDYIVRGHNGRVEVKSTPGEGSTFTVLLPVAEPAGEASPAAAKTG